MMISKRINILETLMRFLAGAVSFIYLLLGIGFLTMPELMAYANFAEPARAVGINTIRGVFSAFFLGMSFFSFLGTLTKHRKFLLIPIVFEAIVITGRLIGYFADGMPNVMGDSIAAEFVFFTVFTVAAAVFSMKQESDKIGIKVLFSYKLIAFISVIILIIAGIFIAQKQIGTKIWKTALSQMIKQDVFDSLPDGLHAGLAGTGSPLPDAKRRGICTFVKAGEKLFIIDSGPGSTLNLELMRLPLGKIEAVLLTHFHSDHIAELGELMLKGWASGSRTNPLDIIGPQGIEKVVKGFNQAYSLDSGYRVAHHGTAIVPREGAGGKAKTIVFPENKDTAVIYNTDGIKVTAFLVDHRPVRPAVGYRFDYKGRSLVISGDTLPGEALRRNSKGVDILFHEALQPKMLQIVGQLKMTERAKNLPKISSDILTYHTFPEEAARIASDCDVKHLVFHHLIPPLPLSIFNPVFMGESKKFYSGPITMGVEGMLFSMPSGTDKIIKGWLLI